MRLSLLRSPKWPDPMADLGKHRIEYALYPHQKCWKGGKTMQKGYEYNYPLITKLVESHNGKLPRSHSFLSVAPGNVILHTVKKAEPALSFSSKPVPGEDVWVLRLFETYGKKTETVISFPKEVKRAVVSNILEQDGQQLPVDGKQVKVEFAPFRSLTIKVWL